MTPHIGTVLSHYYLTLAVHFLHISFSLPNIQVLGFIMFHLFVFCAGFNHSGYVVVMNIILTILPSYGYLLPPNG